MNNDVYLRRLFVIESELITIGVIWLTFGNIKLRKRSLVALRAASPYNSGAIIIGGKAFPLMQGRRKGSIQFIRSAPRHVKGFSPKKITQCAVFIKISPFQSRQQKAFTILYIEQLFYLQTRKQFFYTKPRNRILIERISQRK